MRAFQVNYVGHHLIVTSVTSGSLLDSHHSGTTLTITKTTIASLESTDHAANLICRSRVVVVFWRQESVMANEQVQDNDFGKPIDALNYLSPKGVGGGEEEEEGWRGE